MSDQPAPHVWQAAVATCWAILPERLPAIFEIAARENLGDGGIEAVAARLGRPLDNSRTVTNRGGVAVIPIEGVLVPRASLFSDISGGVSVNTIALDLTAALDDSAITGIVLFIDSPGGDKNGVAELAGMIHAARDRKPIVAYGRELVASGAYWLAAACERIVIASDALVGSIGVVAAVADPSKRSSRDITFVSSQSPHKRIDPTTEAGGKRHQSRVDAVADIFIGDVAKFRGASVAKVEADFGQGDVLVGQAAVDAGMADAVGSFEGVVAELQQRAREPRRIGSGGRMAAQTTGGVMAEQTRFQRMMAWLGGEGDDSAFAAANIAAGGPPEPAPEPTPPLVDPRGNAEIARLNAELARYQEAERTRATADLETRATAFADGEIHASRALPAERDALIAGYTDAAHDDAAHPRAEGQPSRVARLAERHATRPAHGLTTEAVPVRVLDQGTLAILDSPQATRAEGADPAATPERYRDLLASNPATKRILAEHGIPVTGALSAEHRALLTARMEAAGLVPAAR